MKKWMLVAIALIGLLQGCGGGDEPPTDTSPIVVSVEISGRRDFSAAVRNTVPVGGGIKLWYAYALDTGTNGSGVITATCSSTESCSKADFIAFDKVTLTTTAPLRLSTTTGDSCSAEHQTGGDLCLVSSSAALPGQTATVSLLKSGSVVATGTFTVSAP